MPTTFPVYSSLMTSGTGAIFKSGIPIGKLMPFQNNSSTGYNVEFYSDFSQLKYVFAEIITKTAIEVNDNVNEKDKPLDAKLKILEDELKIIEESNKKFQKENEDLKNELNDLNYKVLNLNNEISSQKNTISQFNLDTEELKFLRFNLTYGHKCRKSILNSKGFIVGSLDYKKCVLNKGKIDG